jgi:putative oxidoreductase
MLVPHTQATAGWPAVAALAGRIGLSGIFLVSGLGKLAAPAATLGAIESAGLPFPQLALATAICIELLGSLALLIGYRVRWAACVLAAFSLATAVAFHAHFADQNQLVHFLKNVAIAGGMLYAAIAGGGRFSVDARRGR